MKLTIPPREADKNNATMGTNANKETKKDPFTPDFPQHERHQCNRDHQFGKASEVIPVHVGTKRQSAIAHLAKPIQFSVERQVLQDAEQTETKNPSPIRNHTSPRQ